MLYSITTNCLECQTIPPLLSIIDCKIKELALLLYNNNVFMLGITFPTETMIDLLNYRRILQYKYINPDYAKRYSINQIASRVQILKFK